ncbi:MAG: gluconate 2-dehydrogenase subunit 3 family protein [Chthoniobacterales bacterium]
MTPNEKLLPVDPRTGQPLPPRAQPGYYPGYSTLKQQSFWDAATREVVRKRLHEIPPIRFFNTEEARLMEIVCEHLIPQHDRDSEHRIPLLPFIDERLHQRRTAGYRFEDMPPDAEAYRLGLQAIQKMSEAQHQRRFADLSWREQDDLLKSIHDAKPMPGAEEIWKRMPVHRYWGLVLQDCLEMYYAHPFAWDEIGFGGPAYPRAYMRLERGEAEPWEVDEQRYEWDAPAAAVSDPFEEEIAAHKEHPPTGQGGTH